jgi:translocation and assembly module TamB
MRALVRTGLAVLVLLALVCVCLLLDGSRRQLANLALQQLPSGQWHWQGLSTSAMGRWHLDALDVHREGKLWLEMRDLQLDFRPWDLLRGKARVERLRVGLLRWHAQPPRPAAATFNLPLDTLPPIKLRQLQVQHWEFVGFQRAAPRYSLSASGSYRWREDLLTLALDWREAGSTTALAEVRTESRHARHWQIQGTLNEAPGGFLGSLLALPPQQPLNASLDMEISSLAQQYQLHLNPLRMPWQGVPVEARGTVHLSADAKRWDITQVQLLLDGRSQRLRGQVSPSDLWLEMSLDGFPLQWLQPWLPINPGSATGQLHLAWQKNTRAKDKPWPAIRGQGQVISQWRGQAVNAQGTLQLLADRRLQIEQLEGQLGPTEAAVTVKARGLVDFHGSATDLTLELQQLSDTHLRAMALLPLKANAPRWAQNLNQIPFTAPHIRAQLKGPWRKLEVTSQGELQGRWLDRPLSLVWNGQGTQQQAQFERLQARWGEAAVDLRGLLDWRGSKNRFSSEFSALDNSLWQALGVPLPAAWQASAQGKAEVSGALVAPRVQADLQIHGEYAGRTRNLPYTLHTQGDWQWRWPADSALQALQRADIAQLNLQLDNKPLLNLHGQLQPNNYNLQLQTAELPLALLPEWGLKTPPGTAGLALQLLGSPQAPRLQGQVFYQLKQKRRDGSANLLRWQGQLDTQDGALQLQSDYSEDTQSLAQIRAQAPLLGLWKSLLEPQAQHPLALAVQAQGDLRLTKLLWDANLYPLTGQIQLDLRATGSLQHPQLQGELNIQQGSFEHRLLGTRLRNIALHLAADQHQVRILQGSAEDKRGGQVRLQGSCQWTPQNPPASCALDAQLQRLEVVDRSDLQLALTGPLQVSGTGQGLMLRGDLQVSPLNISVESAISRSIPQLTVQEFNSRAPLQQTLATPWWPALNLDIRLQAAKGAHLRGRGLEAELAGELQIQGPWQARTYQGAFYNPRGTLELFGKRFTLERGQVYWDAGALTLFIPAHYQKGDLDIRAELSGTPRALRLSLSSTPALPQDEILSRLIFGQQVKDITPFEGLRLAAALQSLSQGGFDPVDSARALLGVDSLSVDTQTTDTGTGVNLGVGKYISERVYLEVQRTPNPATPWAGKVQIELTPSLNLESSSGENGRGKAQLLWRHDY